MEAIHFAKAIGLPLVAHLTIYWAVTEVGDDPDGKRFAKVREGLDKWLERRGIELAGAWARESPGGDAEHCHLLFHVPGDCRKESRLLEVETAIRRLVTRHGGGIWGDGAIKLVVWPNPDGKYLLKGGGPEIWERLDALKALFPWATQADRTKAHRIADQERAEASDFNLNRVKAALDDGLTVAEIALRFGLPLDAVEHLRQRIDWRHGHETSYTLTQAGLEMVEKQKDALDAA